MSVKYLVSAILLCLLLATPRAASAEGRTAGVEGVVTASGKPVGGAKVSVGSRSVVSDSRGRFHISAIPLSERYQLTSVVIRARGLGVWRLADARLVAQDTLRITAEMSARPVSLRQPRPRESAQPQTRTSSFTQQSTIASDTTVPQSIRVYVTGSSYCNANASGTVKVVDFKTYVKHVLPNEWMPEWPRESLRAGAMAAKSYGWYQVNHGGKWPGLGADVMDSSCDQVYNPAVSYASTDQAVDDTWNYRITRNGSIHICYYWAGYPNNGNNAGDDRMTQWGSEYWARQGKSWSWILTYYYANTVISSTSTTASDTTAPRVRAPFQAILTSSTLGTTLVPVRLSWSATDADGSVSAYQLQQQVNSDSYTGVSLLTQTSTRVTHNLRPGYSYRYRVRAVDDSGNWSAWIYGPRFYVRAAQETDTSVKLGGAWYRQAQSSAYGGYLRHSSSSSASLRMAFRGRNIAWIAPRGPSRGQARIYVDGTYVKTIDLYSASARSRQVVYSRRWSWLGDHVLEVRVVATAGRPRMDMDAVIVLR